MSHLDTFKTILELKRDSPNIVSIYLSSVNTISPFLTIFVIKLKELQFKCILVTQINITKNKQCIVSFKEKTTYW